jgi:hypothetical protein
MPSPKRNRRERTDEWAKIQQWTLWPEQGLYEQIRPLVLFHETAGERAKEIDLPSERCPAKLMSLKNMGCKVCLHLKSMVGQEKAQRHFHLRYADSSLTCMPTLNGYLL